MTVPSKSKEEEEIALETSILHGIKCVCSLKEVH